MYTQLRNQRILIHCIHELLFDYIDFNRPTAMINIQKLYYVMIGVLDYTRKDSYLYPGS